MLVTTIPPQEISQNLNVFMQPTSAESAAVATIIKHLALNVNKLKLSVLRMFPDKNNSNKNTTLAKLLNFISLLMVNSYEQTAWNFPQYPNCI